METPTLDRKKLVGLVAEKLRLLISEDDPVFSLVVLNEIVLGEFVDIARVNLDDLVNRIEALHELATKLDSSTALIQEEAERLESGAINIKSRLAGIASEAIKDIRLQQENELRKDIKNLLMEFVRNSIDPEIRSNAGDMRNAAIDFAKVAREATAEIKALARKSVQSPVEKLVNQLFLVVMGAAVGVLGFSIAPYFH